MSKLLHKEKEYSILGFDTEADFEKAVIANKTALFGREAVYIDIKRRIGDNNSYHKGLPDGFLIDFYELDKPDLYVVENELAAHNPYSHITEQIGRFQSMIISASAQIREVILETIRTTDSIQKEISKKVANSHFNSLEDLMIYLTERSQIKTIIVIDESTPDLELALNIYKERPDVVTMQRYINGEEIIYFYEPMREELEDLQQSHSSDTSQKRPEFDMVVCAAFPDGFKRAYIEQNAWWAIRLSQEAREKLKYLAIYEKAPKSHIAHFAEIDRIEPYKETGKFKLYLKHKQTIRPVPLSTNAVGEAPQGPRYTTLARLREAKSVAELWN